MTKANFFLVGAAKAGTTSIASFLESQPSVYLPPIKEPCHFCPDINDQLRHEIKRKQIMDTDKYFECGMPVPMHLAHVNDPAHYAQLFEGAMNARIIGECSTYYLPSNVAAENIYAYNPNAKIVAVLRAPVSRIQSHYKMDLRIGLEQRTLDECIQEEINLGTKANFSNCRMYLAMSDYEPQIARFQKYFGANQLKIIRFEDVKNTPEVVLADLLEFLNLSASGVTLKLPRENVGDRAPRFKLLNRVLYQTGAKRALRGMLKRVLPRKALSVLKAIYEEPISVAPEHQQVGAWTSQAEVVRLEVAYEKFTSLQYTGT